MNKYLVKIAAKDEKEHSLALRAATPIATYYAASSAGNSIENHFANTLHKREPEYNHFVHKRTVSKMVRGNKLDVSLKGNPFGVKNKKNADAHFAGHRGVYVPKWMTGAKRNHVYASNKGVALHELGHATASKMMGKFDPARSAARGVGRGVAKYGPIGLIASGNKDEAKYAPAIAAAGGAVTIADEAQANFHAYRALKKYQSKAHANRYLRRLVVPQMGNYLAGAVAPVVGAAAAYKLLYGKKKKDNENGQD